MKFTDALEEGIANVLPFVVPVPQTMEKISARLVEQTVAVPVPQVIGRNWRRGQLCALSAHPGMTLQSAEGATQNGKLKKQFVFFIQFGNRGTIRIFCCFAPAVLSTPIWTKNLLKTPCLPSVFFVFFDVFHAHFLGVLVICRLNPKMESRKSCFCVRLYLNSTP